MRTFTVITLTILAAARIWSAEAPRADQPKPLSSDGIENFFRVTDQIYSGSSPEGDAAFAQLQKLGIKTIITVDGAKPDVETAKRFGIQYIHLPFGYDGVPTNRAVELAKAQSTVTGPIYVHCHHGKHRGPAAVAVMCIASEGWTSEQALQWLKQAGTATNYAGLYRSVGTFERPSKETLAKVPDQFPARVEVSPLVDAMVEIDLRFDHLKLIKEAGYRQPPAHPDLSPAHEALLLQELFKELLRSTDTAARKQDYQDHLVKAEKAALDLHRILNSPVPSKDKADAAFQSLSSSCGSCHKAYRN